MRLSPCQPTAAAFHIPPVNICSPGGRNFSQVRRWCTRNCRLRKPHLYMNFRMNTHRTPIARGILSTTRHSLLYRSLLLPLHSAGFAVPVAVFVVAHCLCLQARLYKASQYFSSMLISLLLLVSNGCPDNHMEVLRFPYTSDIRAIPSNFSISSGFILSSNPHKSRQWVVQPLRYPSTQLHASRLCLLHPDSLCCWLLWCGV